MNGYCCILSKLCYYFLTLKTMTKYLWAGTAILVLSGGLSLYADTGTTNRPNAVIHITPGPDDGRIAYTTARMLENFHFSHHPLDATFATQFMDLYLEALDPQHLHFIQVDLDGFDNYRTNLDRLTINGQRKADVTPAFDIFAHFITRLQERTAYVNDLLKHEKFEFKTDERIAAEFERGRIFGRDL